MTQNVRKKPAPDPLKRLERLFGNAATECPTCNGYGFVRHGRLPDDVVDAPCPECEK